MINDYFKTKRNTKISLKIIINIVRAVQNTMMMIHIYIYIPSKTITHIN